MSLIGGGTDLIEFYREHEGGVVSIAINKYVTVITKKQDPMFGEPFRLSYRDTTEYTNDIDDINHDYIRDSLHYLNIDFPVEVVTVADLPGRGTGLGSSSALLASLIGGLDSLTKTLKYTSFFGKMDKIAVINLAYTIERQYRKCGKQDHYASVYGDARYYQFHQDGSSTVSESMRNTIGPLLSKMFLFYTEIASDKTETILEDQSQKSELGIEMNKLTKIFVCALRDLNYSLCFELIDESWEIKKQFSSYVSNSIIDEKIDALRSVGAKGMKVLGSGGGGFIMGFHADLNKLKARLPGNYMDVDVDYNGLTITKIG